MQAPPPPPRIDLYSRRSGTAKAFLVCLIAATAVILVPLAAAIMGTAIYSFSPAAGIVIGLLILLPMEWILIVRLLLVTRSAAWLDGSVLVVRTAVATHHCDLARASDVALQSVQSGTVVVPTASGVAAVPSGRRVPVLSVRDGPAGKPLRLRLAEPSTGKPLRAPALLALANALQANALQANALQTNVLQTSTLQNHDPAAFHSAVAALHTMAADPKVRKQ